MKKEYTICTLLGITQQDLAMLLGVSRSQCAMYELGQRDLPLPAKQLLAEMLTYVQSHENAAKSTTPPPQKAKLQQLERLLRDNEFQQLLVARKIAVATKKQQAHARLLQLTIFLSTRNTGKHATPQVHQVLVAKASPALEAQFSDAVAELQHRQELLELEKLLLESRVLRMRSALAFPEDLKQ
jgi:transcriptional regulator with XRE-family HTH domain